MSTTNASRLACATNQLMVWSRPCWFNHVTVVVAIVLLAVIVAIGAPAALACPFCSALAPTISDDLQASAAAVVARCESVAEESVGFRIYRMRVVEVVKGDPKQVGALIEVASIKRLSPGESFWMVGYGEDAIEWDSPKNVSSQALSYLRNLSELPKRGPRRLRYFLRHLQHRDEFVSADAYNEFAEASLEDIAAVKDSLDRKWVVGQICDASVPTHRRRLCWTFLSQCGTEADAGLFDQAIRMRSADATFDPGMDAAIACYIALLGEQGLARIEEDYLKNQDARYLDSFAAVSAIRIHGSEWKVLPRKRLAAALHHLVRRPELADLVIPDLARWEDWSVIGEVVKLFESATEETRFLKPVAVQYLKSCPLPSAAKALEKLRAIDSKAVELAESSMMLYPGLATIPIPPPEEDEPSDGLEKPAPQPE